MLISYLCYKTIKSGNNRLGNSRKSLMISSFLHAIIHKIFFIKIFLTCCDVPDVCYLLGCRGQFSLIWPILWLTGGSSDKEPTCQCRRQKRHGFHLWVGKIPWRKAWEPTPVFLPGESHGQKAWRATVYREAKSWTQLRWLNMHALAYSAAQILKLLLRNDSFLSMQ